MRKVCLFYSQNSKIVYYQIWPTYLFRNEVRKGLWAFFLDCASRTLIGWAGNFRPHARMLFCGMLWSVIRALYQPIRHATYYFQKQSGTTSLRKQRPIRKQKAGLVVSVFDWRNAMNARDTTYQMTSQADKGWALLCSRIITVSVNLIYSIHKETKIRKAPC